ncbi:unnamed protein product [Schistosoma margrebowiei]|uniref:Uncharacterized protein n=1 Tax=Schistosoma margrebowiei TaxID=48269 RepID=A0A183MP12_9TREM|nr:unnamed protein product [Schistosoma margrebowiei]
MFLQSYILYGEALKDLESFKYLGNIIDEQQESDIDVMARIGKARRFNIHKGKSKILRYNTACSNLVTIDREDLEDVKTFTYLGTFIDEQGGSDPDVKAWIGKARAAYLQLKNIWNSKQLSFNQLQDQNFRYEYQDISTVLGGNLENYESHHSEDTGVY